MDPDLLGSRNRSPPLPTHCDAPLTYINVRKALLKPAPHQHISPQNPCRRDWIRMKRIFGLQDPHSWDFSRLLPFLLNDLPVPPNAICLQELKQQTDISILSTGIQWDTILKNNPGLESPYNFYDPTADAESRYLYTVRTFWEEGILISGSDYYKPRYWWTRMDGNIASFGLNGWLFIISPNLFLVRSPDHLVTVASRDHALILSDLCSQRYILKNLCKSGQVNEISSIPPWEHVKELLSIHDDMLRLRGNLIYEIIYTLEPLCVSKVVGDIPCGEDGVSHFSQVIERDILEKIGPDQEILQLHTRRNQLLNQVRENNISYFFQLYGLYRLWGHPTLEPLKGVIAVKQLATKLRIPDFRRVHQITNKFKEEMILRYIQKNRKWPELDVSLLGTFNPIRVAYETHREYPNLEKSYVRDHLSLVSFKPLFTVDPKFDISELLADKAMSLGLNDLIEQIIVHHNVGSSIDRSVLIRWMQSELHDPEQFLQSINLNGFGPEEKCNGVREKEREGKLKARLFGLMTLTKRMYIVLTEALLSEHVLSYFPEITMTDDELQLEKKRDSFAKDSETRHCINVSLDFSKWNTNMRDSDTRPFFNVLDQMFGFDRVFSRTHEMFEDSTMYLLDGSYLPPTDGHQLLETIGSWKGHLGGIEGLRQKGWTLWTINLILCVAEKYPFKLKIMGQGDNQLLRLIYPADLSWRQCETEYLSFIRALRDMLNHIGPPLKLEETWASADFYLYGKYPMYKGASYSMSLKKACRAFKNSNEDYPTVESTLSSLAANMFGGLASDISFKHLYVSYLMEVIGTLQRFFHTSYLQRIPPRMKIRDSLSKLFIDRGGLQGVVHDLSGQHLIANRLLLSLVLIPRTLGGYPILHLNHCLIKGNPDPLSFDLATIQSLIPNMPLGVRVILRRALRPLLSRNPNYLLLFENPTALNLDSSPTPSEARKQKILEYLTHSPRVRNPALLEFLQLASGDERDRLCQYISQCDPMNPRVMSLFFNASTTARAIKAINRLNKSPTITALYRQEGEEDLYTMIEKAEFRHCMSVLRQLYQENRGISPLVSPFCSVDQSKQLRSIGWQREIVGVDCTPPQEVCVIEEVRVTSPCTRYTDWELQAGNITYRITKAMSELQIKDITLRGPIAAYRGSITRNKVEALGSSLSSKAPPLLQSVCRLVGTRGWTYQRDGNLDRLARALLESKTDLDYMDLVPDDTNIAGSYHHRLRDERVDGGGTSPMLPILGQRIGIDTSPLVYLNKGTTNKNVMFQTLMIYNQSLLTEQLRAGSIPDSRVYHVHLKSLCCIKDIDERPIENQLQVPPQLVYMNRESPYLFVKKEKLERMIQLSKTHITIGLLSNEAGDLRNRFTNLLAEEIIYILDPSHWGKTDSGRHLLSPVVISWALPCEIDKVISHIGLRLIAYMIPPHKVLHHRKVLNTIMGKVLTSPIESWIKLANLAFSPELHHRLSAPPLSLPGQSEGELTEEAFAALMRKAVLRFMACVRDEPAFMTVELTLCSRHLSPASMHAFYLAEVLSFLNSDREIYVWDQPMRLKRDLVEMDPDVTRAHYDRLSSTWGNHLQVTSESLDYLSKAISSPQPLTSSFRYQPIPRSLNVTMMVELDDSKMTFVDQEWHWEKSGFLKKDYITFTQKPIANPTTAPYKLLSVLSYLNIPIESVSSCACLADGAGGFSVTTAKAFPKSLIFHNTLLFSEKSIPQLPPMPFIPAFSGLPDVERRVIGRDITNELPSDITSNEFSEAISLWVKETFDLVTGDAESSKLSEPGEMLRIFVGYINFCTKVSAQIGIFKAYAANPSVLAIILAIMMTYFERVKVLRSHFSTALNTEVYLIGLSPRLHPTTLTIRGDHIEGHIPSIESRNLLYSVKDTILDSKQRVPLQDIIKFSEWISHPLPLADHELELKTVFPWLYESNTIRFPQDFLYWIRSFHRASTKGKSPRFRDTTRSNFSATEIKTAILSLLFGYLAPSSQREQTFDFNKLFMAGHLIWYRTMNEGWGFTLYDRNPPNLIDAAHIWLYPIKDFITDADKKRFFRMVGLFRLIRDPPSITNISTSVLNFPFVRWEKVHIPKAWKPKNEWLSRLATIWERGGHKKEALPKHNIPSTLSLWNQRKRLHERRAAKRKL